MRRGRAIAARIEAGTVNVNEGYAAAWGSVGAPMGGMKASGLGRRHGRRGHPQVHRGAERHGAGAGQLRRRARPARRGVRRALTRRAEGDASGAGCRERRGRARRRRRRRRVRVRRVGRGAAAGREGLPRLRPRVRPPVRGRRVRPDLVGPAALPLGAAPRLLRRPAHPPAARRRHARRRRRRRRLAQLRQHPLRPPRRVLRGPAVGRLTDWEAELAPHYDHARAGCSASSPTRATGPSSG